MTLFENSKNWIDITDDVLSHWGGWGCPDVEFMYESGEIVQGKYGWVEEYWDGYSCDFHDGSFNYINKPDYYRLK